MSQAAEKKKCAAAPAEEAHFHWEDPLEFEGELSHEERMVRDTARGYAQERLFRRVLKAFREEHFDREILREMGALGLLGATLPEPYGGAGLSYVAHALLAPESRRGAFRHPSASSSPTSPVVDPLFPCPPRAPAEQRTPHPPRRPQ